MTKFRVLVQYFPYFTDISIQTNKTLYTYVCMYVCMYMYVFIFLYEYVTIVCCV
jgi:hypothetical protein